MSEPGWSDYLVTVPWLSNHQFLHLEVGVVTPTKTRLVRDVESGRHTVNYSNGSKVGTQYVLACTTL